jgi:sterol desaturase/sphingolipid hydroxylase (fatty acid hydroxylase superfamily)
MESCFDAKADAGAVEVEEGKIPGSRVPCRATVRPRIVRVPVAIALAVLLAVLFVLERRFALRRGRRPLLGRLLVNACISVLAVTVATLLVRPVATRMLDWTSETPFGLLHVVPMPPAAQYVVAFLLMDLTFYWWHVANHRIPLLWRFHNVHHIDPDLDVSTAFRFHFGEVALSAIFRVVQIGAIGLSVWMFAVYEFVFQANTAFHHSNIRLPIGIERVLNLVLVTPRMHGIHHSEVRHETNSNYSVVLSWWDRLHRTLGLNIPQSEIVIGVPGYAERRDNSVRNTLLLPFQRQREYWRRADGTPVERAGTARGSDRKTRLAE